jgi:hypothetical protein
MNTMSTDEVNPTRQGWVKASGRDLRALVLSARPGPVTTAYAAGSAALACRKVGSAWAAPNA